MHTRRWGGLVLLCGLIGGLPATTAQESPTLVAHWRLESTDDLQIKGHATSGTGVQGKCLVLDGQSLGVGKESSQLTNGDKGFSVTVWVNPYALNRGQQMIVGKNQYSLNRRQWGLMIDADNRFRLYVHQGQWQTAACEDTKLEPGHWYQLAIVVRAKQAELFLNGQRQSTLALDRPIPTTEAPITIGGIDDNGRIRQNLWGAIDEVRFYDAPLGADEIKAGYRPTAETHQIPIPPERYVLWDDSGSLPKTAEMPVLEGVAFHVIKPYEPNRDGYRFLHGVALAFHNGRWYASFGHNQEGENTASEEARFCTSDDGGKTWSKVRTIDAGDQEGVAVSHGVFLSRGGELWAFHGSFSGILKGVHTRAYVLDESTGQWRPKGTIIREGFWPMQQPQKMSNGNWIMSGIRVGDGNPAAVAVSNGDDLLDWQVKVIEPAVANSMWGESAVVVDGANVLNIARYGDQAWALAATSSDFGRTWTTSIPTNLPMVTSKPYAGTLSTGQRYLIATTTADSGKRRAPLTIAVTRPGESSFSNVFVIRHANFPGGPGETHPTASLAYPYAVEHEGKLYVGYSNNGGNVGRSGTGRELWNNNSAELAVIPIEQLRGQ